MPQAVRFFSVIIPTYNRSDEIKELISSLEKQSVDKNDFEVIIVDDGSTDDTGEVIRQPTNSRPNIILYLPEQLISDF